MKRIPLLNLVLFLATFLSTLFWGALHAGVDLFAEPGKIYKGFPFAVSLMSILLSHELAHYFASRRHGVRASLPYFIPAPTIIGTFGAFIKMKSPIATRKALIDIGASGPIAGFIVSLAAVVFGLHWSDFVPEIRADGVPKLGDSMLFSLLARIILGETPPGTDILLNPVAFAGWIGLFVTSINLLPVGQLDGGHIAYALMGEKHTLLSVSLILLMILLGFLSWVGWFVWAGLLLVLGLRHPPVIYWEVPLDRKRKAVGLLALMILILTFIPAPFELF